MLVLVGGLGLFYGLGARYSGEVPCRFILIDYGRGRVSQLSVRDFCGYVRLLIYRRFYREELRYSVFLGHGVDRSLDTMVFGGHYRLISLLSQRTTLSFNVSAAGASAVLGHTYGCYGSAIFRCVECVFRFRSGAGVQLVETVAIRYFLPYRSLS